MAEQTTEAVRTQVNTETGTVRIVEVPVEKPSIFNWDSAFQHIQQGAWAVGLTVVFLWVSTANVRRRLGEGITEYFKKQIEILETVKDSTTSNATVLSAMESRAKHYQEAVQHITDNTNETVALLREMRDESKS